MTLSVGTPATPAPPARLSAAGPASSPEAPGPGGRFAGLLRGEVADQAPADRAGTTIGGVPGGAAAVQDEQGSPTGDGTGGPPPAASLVPAWLAVALQAGTPTSAGTPGTTAPGVETAVAAGGGPDAGDRGDLRPIAPVPDAPAPGSAPLGVGRGGPLPTQGSPVAVARPADPADRAEGSPAVATAGQPAEAQGVGGTGGRDRPGGPLAAVPPAVSNAAGAKTVQSGAPDRAALGSDGGGSSPSPVTTATSGSPAVPVTADATDSTAGSAAAMPAPLPSSTAGTTGTGTRTGTGTGTGTGQQSIAGAPSPDDLTVVGLVTPSPGPSRPAATAAVTVDGSAAVDARALDARGIAATDGPARGAVTPPAATEAAPADDLLTLGPAAPPTPAATGPTGTSPSAPAAAPAPPVATQLTPQLTAMATGPDGSHAVTVVLAPESLGEVRVQLVVTGDQVAVTLAAGQEQGRAALAQALPDLRRDLAAAGLTVTSAEVSSDVPDSSTGSGASAGQQSTPQGWGERSGAATRLPGTVPTGRPTADEEPDTTRTTRHTRTGGPSTGVDVRA